MKKIYFVGAPTDAKGIEEFNQLAGMHPKASFYWICYKIDETLRKKFKHINFLTGLDDKEMQKWVKKMDLFICLSRYEGFCLPIAEALLLNKPVISFKLSEIESVFEDNIEYIPSGNLKLFSEKVGDFIYDGTYTKDSAKAKTYVIYNFSPEKVTERFLGIISSTHA